MLFNEHFELVVSSVQTHSPLFFTVTDVQNRYLLLSTVASVFTQRSVNRVPGRAWAAVKRTHWVTNCRFKHWFGRNFRPVFCCCGRWQTLSSTSADLCSDTAPRKLLPWWSRFCSWTKTLRGHYVADGATALENSDQLSVVDRDDLHDCAPVGRVPNTCV